MHFRAALLIACISAPLLAADVSSLKASTPEGAEPQQKDKPQETQAEKKGEAEEKSRKKALKDRLEVSAGLTGMEIHSHGRSTTHPRHFDRLTPLSLQQTTDIRFESVSGTAVSANATFEVAPRLQAAADFTSASPGDAAITDTRRMANFSGPGDFTLAGFESSGAPKYVEWALGGLYQLFPGKKKGLGSKVRVDAVLMYRKADVTYNFLSGRLVDNPFDPNSLRPGNFDTLGLAAANYDLNFETLTGGVRIGRKITDRVSVGGIFEPVWFARYRGTADLGGHGLVFVHDGAQHVDPSFSTSPNCNSTDRDPLDPNRPNLLTPNCGMVEADLKTTGLKVRQESSRGKGLGLELNTEVKLTDWIAIVAGYHRQDFRSLGGTEVRNFQNEASILCAPSQKNKPRCDEHGDLDQAGVVSQGFFLRGRFRFF